MQLAVFIAIYMFAALPLWLTPVAHVAHWISETFTSAASRSSKNDELALKLAYAPAS